MGARRPGSESAAGPRRCEPGQLMTVPKVVFALYRTQEARKRVCRWAQEMRARSVNDCPESRLCFVSYPGGQKRVCRWAQEMRARSVNDCFEKRLCFVSEHGARERARSVNDCFGTSFFSLAGRDILWPKSAIFQVAGGVRREKTGGLDSSRLWDEHQHGVAVR
jgi:hypothetical protein